MISLLFQELEKKDKEDLEVKNKEKFKRKKVDRIWPTGCLDISFMQILLLNTNLIGQLPVYNMQTLFTTVRETSLNWHGSNMTKK